MAEAILSIPVWLYNSFSGADFRANRGAIYVPFYYINRFSDPDFKERTARIDYGAVHELSHILWDKIAGDRANSGGWRAFREWRKFFEGFATYCADDFFADFYPKGIRKYKGLPRTYTDGKEEVETLIAKHGTGILLEIPKRWKEFSAQ